MSRCLHSTQLIFPGCVFAQMDAWLFIVQKLSDSPRDPVPFAPPASRGRLGDVIFVASFLGVSRLGTGDAEQELDAGYCFLRRQLRDVGLQRFVCRSQGPVKHGVHEREDLRLAAIILTERQLPRVRNLPSQNVKDPRFGAAEAVDRLFGVADDEQSSRKQPVATKQAHNVVLNRIGILELVDHEQRDAGLRRGGGRRHCRGAGSGPGATGRRNREGPPRLYAGHKPYPLWPWPAERRARLLRRG